MPQGQMKTELCQRVQELEKQLKEALANREGEGGEPKQLKSLKEELCEARDRGYITEQEVARQQEEIEWLREQLASRVNISTGSSVACGRGLGQGGSCPVATRASEEGS